MFYFLCYLPHYSPFPSLLFQDGWTALMYAAEEGFVAVVQALLEAGADIDIKNEVISLKYFIGTAPEYSPSM